jgi:uncharacterized membrane protein YvlD (DUF360 family)
VPFVGRVPVSVVHIVGVIAVRHRYVAAVRPVLMGVTLVRNMRDLGAFVHVIAVRVVDMAVMGVIGVIAVRNRHVTAALAVGVLVAGVCRMLKRVRHRTRPLWARADLA